jgi:hypothetical protein
MVPRCPAAKCLYRIHQRGCSLLRPRPSRERAAQARQRIQMGEGPLFAKIASDEATPSPIMTRGKRVHALSCEGEGAAMACATRGAVRLRAGTGPRITAAGPVARRCRPASPGSAPPCPPLPPSAAPPARRPQHRKMSRRHLGGWLRDSPFIVTARRRRTRTRRRLPNGRCPEAPWSYPFPT